MNYYITRVAFNCPQCSKLATHDVRGSQNESYGKFCRKHAEGKVKYLKNLREAAERKKQDG